MKLKFLLFVCCLGLFSFASADNRHVHPKADIKGNTNNKSAAKGARWPGFCEIEIVNYSYDDVRVFGKFDDGTTLEPFVIYRYGYDTPQTISLYYYEYCHSGMNLYIDSINSGYRLYAGYTPVQQTIKILPMYAKKSKVEVHAK
ncbi:hypothetical protein [Legionella fairfieldensis]|uniref:hypothetical protein n=1 Tax=Legionella fairfieldensis TaxID=45064 RepID=UPI00048E31E2|nr:hypothetical protein [Legionella fairfieldensis]